MERKGCFIVVEGPDGSGKSTVVKRIAEYLSKRGLPSAITRELGGTPFAERIRDLILSPHNETCQEDPVPMTELMLAWASRFQHLETKIKPALERGDFVVTDRYYWSTRAFQGTRGVSHSFMRFMEEFSCLHYEGFFLPDIIFYLDVSFEESEKRLASRNDGNDRMDNFDIEIKKRIFQSYNDSMADHINGKDKASFVTDLHRINADASQEVVMSHISLVLENYLQRLGEKT